MKNQCVQYSKEVLELVAIVDETNGAEVPKWDWEDFNECIECGLLRWVSGARGPGEQWKRINLTTLGESVCQDMYKEKQKNRKV